MEEKNNCYIDYDEFIFNVRKLTFNIRLNEAGLYDNAKFLVINDCESGGGTPMRNLFKLSGMKTLDFPFELFCE